jgi:hypothetical protein
MTNFLQKYNFLLLLVDKIQYNSVLVSRLDNIAEKLLSSIFFICARLRIALVWERLWHSVAPPRLRPGLLSLCSVTSFRRFPVFFPHKKSKTFSLRSYVLCGFICARLRLTLVRERLGRSALNNPHKLENSQNF